MSATLDGRQIEAFLAVAEHGHFLRAADALGIAQSVLSKRLARLEDEIGATLVERSGKRPVNLTRAGELFANEARSALDALQRARRIGRNLARGTAGPLRIGYVFSAAMCGLLPSLMRKIRAALPEAELQLLPLATPAQIIAIDAGKLDIAIVRPRASYPAGVVAQRIHQEPLVIAMADDHPLAAKLEVLPGDLRQERFILPQFDEDVGLVDALRDLARVGGFDLPPLTRTDDFISAACLAAAGVGVLLAPASLAQLGIVGLSFRPIRAYGGAIALTLLHRADMPPATRDLLATINAS